ncbi:MAG: DUF2059 domain-containing protein [Bacteroidales bacterium]
MRTILIIAFIFGITLSAFTQTSSENDKIKKMLELTGSGKIGVQIAQKVISSFREKYPDIDQHFWDELEKEIKPDDLINTVIPIYAKYYSENDIDQIIAFYNSPAGKKMIELTPLILQESMTSGKNWGVQIAEKIIKRLKENGYLSE